MKSILFPFQETALEDLHSAVNDAHLVWSEKKPQVISFSAPTGAGKTIIMTTLFEEILYGSADNLAEPDSVFIWLSDSPQLNEQSRLKIENKSDKIAVRYLNVIDDTFNAEYFEGGSIYFLNTQKLGVGKLLTQKSDTRQYTIWETLTNTAQRQPKQFYVIIDEAHRGTATLREETTAQSIMQKFIKGSEADGLCIMPLVIGVTATPQKFDALISDTKSAVQKVVVPPQDVRESGLLKDRIIIHYPEIAINADITMFTGAVENWIQKREHWSNYCKKENEKNINPVLVIQVEDGSAYETTRTDLRVCIEVIEEKLGRKLRLGEAVHTFNDKGTITEFGAEIQKIDASHIEDDPTAIVVFFKMNLSTGWDCPRAETLMSFRNAQEHTYVAQLLGRMVRTPLARRVMDDAELNNVTLYLPNFNAETVKAVKESLESNEGIFPGESGSHSELVTLKRDLQYSDVFDSMSGLPTYRIDAARKQQPLRLYMQLSRALKDDEIDVLAYKNTKKAVLGIIEDYINKIKSSGEFDKIVATLTGFEVGTMLFDYGQNTVSFDEPTQTMNLSQYDISKHFDQAGKLLGDGLNIEYWVKNSTRDEVEVKVEVIVFANSINAMEELAKFSTQRFNDLYDKYAPKIARLKEARRTIYNKLTSASVTPIAIDWVLPSSIDYTVSDESKTYEKHLYVNDNGAFNTTLNTWEDALIKEEAKNGMVCWLRNLDRKKWSLEIPYRVNGETQSMYPDFVVVKTDASTMSYVFDILEPHDPSRTDNCDKAVGLAEFAEKHSGKFNRIQLIRRKKGADNKEHFYRLNLTKLSIQKKVRGIKNNEQLDEIFDSEAERED
jgi:type III restriction enzyme